MVFHGLRVAFGELGRRQIVGVLLDADNDGESMRIFAQLVSRPVDVGVDAPGLPRSGRLAHGVDHGLPHFRFADGRRRACDCGLPVRPGLMGKSQEHGGFYQPVHQIEGNAPGDLFVDRCHVFGSAAPGDADGPAHEPDLIDLRSFPRAQG